MALTEIDKQLLNRCISEKPGAWKDFVDRFMGLFVHVINHSAQARSVKLSPDDLDDLCSEVFLALISDDYAILRHFEGKSALATYLTVIARRIVVKEISRRRMAEAFGHVSASQSSLDLANGNGKAKTSAEQQRIEDADEVKRMLEELPQQDAAIVRLFHLEGKSYHEISRTLGVAENSIGPTLFRAREKLRQRQVQS